MGSTNHYSMSQDMMKALEDFLQNEQDRLFNDSKKLSPQESAERLAQLRGQREVRDLQYKLLPKEQQHGWNILIGSERSLSGGSPPSGGGGESQEPRRRSQRRKTASGPAWGLFSSFNRNRHSRHK